jgi:3-hydroxy acid dehydrogenase/malonic semialdehyde reductase
MTDLSKSTVFITGATSGFGAAAARRFAQAGSRLVLCGRRTDRLEALRAELQVPAHLLTLDVRDRDAVFAAVESLPPEFADIDVLVNNAGLAAGLGKAHEADLDDWDVMVDTNIKGVMYCTRAVLPGMIARNRGHLIQLGSVAATYPYPGGNAYGGTKAFVAQFSLGLRSDLVGTKVRVTVIEPGLCETEFSIVRFRGDVERANKVYENTTPLTGDDVAECIFWTAGLPENININRLEVMPVVQAFSPFTIHRVPST